MMTDEQEITAELTAEAMAGVSDVPLSVTFAAKSDLGRVRENNEDKFDWWEPDSPEVLKSLGRLYAVSDGMGGHAAGQIASEMALKTIGKVYYADPAVDPRDALERAIRAANTLVHVTGRAVPSRAGMGCTIVAVALVGSTAIIGWVGDSRAYLVRGGAATCITEDHSLVQEQVRAGILTEEEAATSGYRNVITRSIGAEENVQPEFRNVPLSAGDAVLLCSDGLTGVVGDTEIGEAVCSDSPSFACSRLVDVANEKGGPDNITVAILRVNGVQSESPEPQKEPKETEPETRERGFLGLLRKKSVS
jgi:serine/threonine protein phosphatase PrpC